MSRIPFIAAVASAMALRAARTGAFGHGPEVVRDRNTISLHTSDMFFFTRVEKWQDGLVRLDGNGKVIPLTPYVEYRVRPFKIKKLM